MARKIWARVVLGVTVAVGSMPWTPAYAQDGSVVYRQRCAMCHVTARGARPGIGPNLSGVVGRSSGSTTFTYSAAIKNAAVKWDKATLDKFLTGPTKMIPGTRMVVSIPDPKQRAALVAYLATLK